MDNRDVKEFLAGIRRTIADSDSLIESAKLRLAETDRMLERQGLTREQVLKLEFSPEQYLRANEELRRLGLPELAADEASRDFAQSAAGLSEAAAEPPPDDELAERSRKFRQLMHGYRA